VTIKLWMMPTCFAPSSVQQKSQDFHYTVVTYLILFECFLGVANVRLLHEGISAAMSLYLGSHSSG
jgi:hypothetical protein